LSGFLITRILLQTRDAENYFSSFYARRLLRISPIYYVSLLVLFLAVPVILRTASVDMPSIHERVWYFAYVQNWLNVFGRLAWPGLLTHYWSLGVEEQFYLIWPLIIYFFAPKRVLQIIIGACLFSIVLRLTLMGIHTDPETIYRNTFTRMDALLIGAACAFLVRNESLIKQIHRHATWLCLGPLITLAALRTQPFRTTAPTEVGLGYTIIALSYAGLLMAVVVTTNNGSILQRILGSRIMRGFGKYSYAAYIWHILIRQLVLHYELETLHALPPAFVNIPLMVAATLAASALSYIVVERPFLALRGYFEPRPAQEPALQRL
jgi:peptidoglycan/LPS O-acetylase OafA/YrhL